jgi:hypothetical protein
MAVSPRLTIKKYFGNASLDQMELSLADAKSQLDYFWTKNGGSNVIVAIDGKKLRSYEELVELVNQDRYKNKSFIEVGLFLSNDGHDSIWPK